MRRGALLALPALALVGVAYATVLVDRPDPNVQAVEDGCKRDRQAIFAALAPNWVYVNDRDYPATGPPPPPQWLTGTANAARFPYLAVHPSGGDDPVTHLAYDLNINVLPDERYAALAGGDPDGGTGNFFGEGEETGRVHTERESTSLPLFAWPEGGDRILQLGSWVWDCDHTGPQGERTEFHPFRALWVQRNPVGSASGPSPRSKKGEAEGDLFVSTDATPAGIVAECAHETKNVNFKPCLRTHRNWLSVDGHYEFALPATPRPSPAARLKVRVLDAGSTANAPQPAVKLGPTGATVSFDIAGGDGVRLVLAKQVFLGWSPMPQVALPEHVRVSLTRLLVRRAMDPSCPPDKPECPFKAQSTRLGQIATAPGEWNLYWNVAGIWGQWKPITLHARDGQSFKGSQSVDVYLAKAGPWRVYALARECDFGVLGSFRGQSVPVSPCPRSPELGHQSGDDYPGSLEARFRSVARGLGSHTVNSIVTGSTCPVENRQGCYALSFTARRIDDAAARAR